MDFITDIGREVTLQEALSYLYTSDRLTTLQVRELPVVTPIPYGADVTYTCAMDVYAQSLENKPIVETLHPTARAGRVIMTYPILITQYGMEYKIDGVVRKDVIVRSFLIPREVMTKAAKIIVAAHSSEALAYLYTEPSATKVVTQSKELVSNFRSQKVKETLRAPMGDATMPTPAGWSKGDAEKNRDSVYSAIASPKQMIAVENLVLRCIEATSLKHFESTIVTMSRHISVPAPIRGYTIEVEPGRYAVKSIYSFVPPRIGWAAYDQSYRYLSMMRALRGEDEKWLSPLTAGYYWAATSRSVATMMWLLADILHIVRMNDLAVVFFPTAPSSVISVSLVLNDIVVLVHSPGVPDKMVYTELENGDQYLRPAVYRVNSIEDMYDYKMLVYCSGIFLKPTVDKKNVSYPQAEQSVRRFIELVEDYSDHIVMTHAFLSPSLEPILATYPLTPSIHAHAGHVVLTNGPFDTFEVSRLLIRMSHANCIKTWFPLSRFRMLEFDMTKFGFNNLAFASGFMMSYVPIRVEKSDIFASALTEDERESIVIKPHEEMKEDCVTDFYAGAGFAAQAVPYVPPPPVIRIVAPVVAPVVLPTPVVVVPPPPPPGDEDDLLNDMLDSAFIG